MSWVTGASLGRKPRDATRWTAIFSFTQTDHLWVLCLAVFFAVCSALVQPVVAIFIGNFADGLTQFGGGLIESDTLHKRTNPSFYGFIGLGFCTLLTNAGMFTTWVVFGELQAKAVREELFRSLLKKDLEWFEMREHGVASLLTRLQSQIREMQLGTSQPFSFLLQGMIQGLVAFGIAIYHSWKVTLTVLAIVPVSGAALYLLGRGLQRHIASQDHFLAEATKIAHNAFINIALVKCFNAQSIETTRYVAVIRKAATYSLKQANIVALQTGSLGFFFFVMFLLGFWYGNKLVHDGDYSTGQVTTAIWATFMSVQGFQSVFPHVIVLVKGHAAASAVRALIDTVEKGRLLHRKIDGASPVLCEGHIKLRQVSFAYPSRPDQLVLFKSDFDFCAGRTTFIVGKSGSGKSTLSNLIMRFYFPLTGTISIDGHDLEDLDTSWLRNNITCVQQGTSLFDETLRVNIALGHRYHERVKAVEIDDCVRLAALEDTIAELPYGMDTQVGVGGSALSGGQSQRVAIARARLRDTPILILDESTSALDNASRVSVIDGIRKWRDGLTSIIITHDLTQIRDQDFVYIMDHGHIIRKGPRSEVCNAARTYRDPLNTTTAPALDKVQPIAKGDVTSRSRPPNRPPNLRWRKDGNMLRASFEEQLRGLDVGDYLLSPKALLGAARIASAFQDQPTLSRSSNHAAYRHSQFISVVNPCDEALPLPEQTEQRNVGGTEIALRPLSLAPNRASEVARPRPGNTRPLPSPRVLEKSKAQFRARFGGPTFSLVEDKSPQMSLQSILGTLWSSLDRSHRIKLLTGLSAVCCRAALPSLLAYIMSKMFAIFYQQEGYKQASTKWAMVQLVVGFTDAATAFIAHYMLEGAARRWVGRLRAEAVRRVMEQPKPWFEHDSNSASSLSLVLDRDAEEMRALLCRFVSLTISVVLMLCVAIIWSFVSCWRLTLVGLAATPVIYGLAKGFNVISEVWEGRVNTAAEAVGKVFVETFTDIRTVRSLTLESYFHRKYSRATKSAFATGRLRALYTGLLYGLSESTITFTIAVILWYAIRLASSYDLGVAPIITSICLLILASGPANVIFGIIPQTAAAVDSATRLIRLTRLALKNEHEHGGQDRLREPSGSLSMAICFNSLTFAYPSRSMMPTLSNLTLSIKHGECVAIAGRSGSGKSTIAYLLSGLYRTSVGDPGVGPSITIFGQDMRSLELSTLRTKVAVVPQHPVVFPGTVWENICYGLEAHTRLATIQNVNWAATQAAIHDFILSLPLQYDTVIGEGGLGVSGGQAQRITLARALVRRPRILVLDEVTSALDAESADLIRSSLRTILRESRHGTGEESMTILVITHAREMMEFADRVVLLEGGSVAEEGPFAELMVRGGMLREVLAPSTE